MASLPSASPALAIRDLRFTYPGGPSLHVPRLDLHAGDQLLLTGPSGCGKSTLLNLTAGLLTADGGSITVAGRDIQALRGAARDHLRGRRIGMVFQTFNLLNGFSAIENVMLAMLFSDVPARTHRDRAAALLDSLGIDAQHRSRAADRLSIGQQQRTAVARALACSPALVLADEPTASLDPDNASTAIEVLKAACAQANAALLCVSHDPALPSHFTRHLTMSQLASPATVPAA